MLTTSPFGKVIHNHLPGVERRGAVRPEVTALSLLKSWRKHRQRRLELYPAGTYPLSKRRARDGDARAAKDLFLTIERKMARILRHQHLCEKPRRREPLVDHLRRHRRLDQRLTALTGPFSTDVPLDLHYPGEVIEFLTDILADAPQRTPAATDRGFRLMAISMRGNSRGTATRLSVSRTRSGVVGASSSSSVVIASSPHRSPHPKGCALKR